MKIRTLELENFRCFKEQLFEFPDGLIGILGPNGSGKSTILEALSWALYGSSALRTTREDLRLDSASDSAPCRVKMKFLLDREKYELERRMTGKTLSPRAYIKNSEDTLVESFQGVTQYVEDELLRMKESSFFKSVFSKQNEVRELSRGGPEERRQLFAKLLDIDRIKAARREVDADARGKRQRADALSDQLGNLDEMEAKLREKEGVKAELTKKVDSLDRALTELNEALSRNEDEFQVMEEKKDELNDLEKNRENLLARIKSHRDNIEERKEELEQLKRKKEEARRLEDSADEFEELKQTKEELEEEKDRYHEKKEMESRLESRKNDLSKEKAKLKRITNRLEDLEEIPEKLKEKKAERKEKDELVTDLKARVAEIENSISKHRSELKELKEKSQDVEDLGTEGECPVCKRPLGDDYETVIKHYQEDIDSAEKAIRELGKDKTDVLEKLEKAEEKREEVKREIEELTKMKEKMASLEDRKEDLGTRIEELERAKSELEGKLDDFPEIDYEEEKYINLKEELESLKKDYDRYRNLRAETKRAPSVEDKLEENRANLEEVKIKFQRISNRIDDLEFDAEKFKELKNELRELRDEKDDIKDKYSKKSERLAELKTEINHLEEDIEDEREKRKTLDKLKEEKALLDRVSGYFDQFRLDLLNRIRPVLSRRASRLLERTTDGLYRKLTIDDEYLVRVYEDGEPYPLDRFSGGETDLANLCLRVAISELVARRSGRPINFIVLDEIFGSQDQQRRQNILKALRNLDDLFGQIFLITHSEEVKERLENVLLLNRESHDTTSVQTLF